MRRENNGCTVIDTNTLYMESVILFNNELIALWHATNTLWLDDRPKVISH